MKDKIKVYVKYLLQYLIHKIDTWRMEILFVRRVRGVAVSGPGKNVTGDLKNLSGLKRTKKR